MKNTNIANNAEEAQYRPIPIADPIISAALLLVTSCTLLLR